MAATIVPTYQLRITLMGSDPPIWRQLEVPPTITLAALHGAIQVAMGWEDDHLHGFVAGLKQYGAPVAGLMKVHSEDDARLYRVLPKVGERMLYAYDFRDSWKHEVRLEAIHRQRQAPEHPVCIAGERACPPEDCGGIRGYRKLLEVIGNPDHPEHEEQMEWLGDFDPEAFDLDAVNEKLRHIR